MLRLIIEFIVVISALVFEPEKQSAYQFPPINGHHILSFASTSKEECLEYILARAM
jgi:hypothetical protein